MILSTTAYAEPRYTERKSKEDERWLWDELSKYSPSDVVTAGVLSFFWRESQYRSDAVAGWATSQKAYGIDYCKRITEKTDEGFVDGSSRDYFIRKVRWHGGYGLGQWFRMDYVEDLYDFAMEYGTSIGDAQMQVEFVFYSMQKDEELWDRLLRCKDPEKAGRLMAIYYDGSLKSVDYMGYKAKKLYEKYGGD